MYVCVCVCVCVSWEPPWKKEEAILFMTLTKFDFFQFGQTGLNLICLKIDATH